MKYLAGAYHAANGDHNRAMHLYARGYYDVAKRQRLERAAHQGIEGSGNLVPALAGARSKPSGKNPAEAHAQAISAAPHRGRRSGAVPRGMR